MNSRDSPSGTPREPVARRTSERARPAIRTGIATAAPASGPAAPMSIRAFRSGNGDLRRISAPIVPGSGGIGRKGMKYGGDTRTRCRRAAV